LGTAWHNRGHDVTFGVRNPDDPKYASLGAVRANDAATSDADVVVLCTPWQGTQQAVQGCGDPLTSGVQLAERNHIAVGHDQRRRRARADRVIGDVHD